MTANVSGKNYQIDENGNLTVTGRTLYLSDINIAGDVTIPAGMSYRRVILENVNIGGTIRVQNANTTLWTNGRAAGVTVSAALCSITVRDGVRVTEADGAQETIINKASSQPLYAAAMSDNGDLTGIPDGRGFSLALVSGEDILNLAGWSSRRAGETVNICSTLLGRGATEPGFGRLRLDKALLFGTVPTSYASRYSLGAMKTLFTTAERNGLRLIAAFAMHTESPRCATRMTMSISETWFITTTFPRSARRAARSAAEHSTRKSRVRRAKRTNSR